MIHLRSIIHPWRPSDKKDWIINPVIQIKLMMSLCQCTTRHMQHSIRVIKSRRANGMLEDEANNITAVDVYQYTQRVDVEQSKPVARIVHIAGLTHDMHSFFA